MIFLQSFARPLPLQRFAQLAESLAQLAGEQRVFLFQAGNGSPGLASCRRRVATRQLYCSASLRLLAGCSTSFHPIPPNGLGAGEMLAHRSVPAHSRPGVSSHIPPELARKSTA